MRLATALAIRGPLPDVIEQARLVDALGYESIWVPEIAGRDALVTCGILSGVLERTGLATGIVPLGVRTPVTLAMGAAALAEATDGRFTLGVGLGHRETLRDWHQIDGPVPLREARRQLEIVRTLLRDGSVDNGAVAFRFRGTHHGAAPAVILASLQQGSARLAAHVADGVVLNWVTPDYVRSYTSGLRQHAERAGRDPDSLEIACFIPVCVTDDVALARRELARQLSAYGGLDVYAAVIGRAGYSRELASALTGGEVPDHLLDDLGAHGEPDDVAAKLEEFVAAGVTLPILTPYPAGEDPWASMTLTWSSLAPDA